jgi:hypothetical protein
MGYLKKVMTHQQILDKVAAKSLVASIDEDLTRLTWMAMTSHKQTSEQMMYIFSRLFMRWNCVLEADSQEIPNLYKHKTSFVIAVVLHKYGYADSDVTSKALNAVDKLNDAVALSDDFFKKSNEIKQFLKSTPTILKRRPVMPDSMTFYRNKDVISIQLDNKFYAAYIHCLHKQNEIPIIEFYDAVFDKVPTMKMLEKIIAKGQKYNDGVERVSRFAISGMKYMPDPANQIKHVSACIQEPPSIAHLERSVGLYAFSDIFEMQRNIKTLFHGDNNKGTFKNLNI